MTDSQQMTRAEVATFARCSTVTVYRAWVAYRQSGGKRGLRGVQRGGPNSTVWFEPEDVDRWTNGEAPVAPAKSRLRRSA